MNKNDELIVIDSLRAGVDCPACLKPLNEGENAYICGKCGAINHEVCWQRAGCGSYHCQTGNSVAFDSSTADIVITKNDLKELKEIPPNSRYGTAVIAKDIASKQIKTWSILSIFALIIGFFTLIVSSLKFTGEISSSSQSGFFLLTLGGCLISVLLCSLSIAILQNNSNKKGLILSFTGMGCAIFALVLTIYPLLNESKTLNESFKVDMGQISDTISSAPKKIKQSLIANVYIKSTYGYNIGFGSGIALCNVDAFTYILTNEHVLSLGKKVKNLEELKNRLKNIQVTIYSGATVSAEPVWLAPDNIDLALIRITTPNGFVPHIKYKKGRPIVTGQRVFAIGNPQGLNWTYTDGVVSALRQIRHGSRTLRVIQMQTPLNHGNSGGGLYDLDGYLIGVNTWIYEKNVSEGLNFSISFDELFKLLDPKWSNILALKISKVNPEKE